MVMSLWHTRLTVVVLRDVGVAAVELEHVDAPVSEGLRVELVVVQCTRESSARPTTHVLVQAQLQTLRMDLQFHIDPRRFKCPGGAAGKSNRRSCVALAMRRILYST